MVFLWWGKLRVWHIFLIDVFLLSLTLSARAATCDAGYWLNESNKCVKCQIGENYYCPGDDTKVPCPTASNEYFSNLANDTFGESTIISIVLGAWQEGGLITEPGWGCYADVFIQTAMGNVLVESSYAENYFHPGKQFWYKAAPGYYLSNYYGWTTYYKTVLPCENTPPVHAHFSEETEPDNPICLWKCDDGFGRTENDTCLPLCTAGITQLHTGTGLVFNIYANKQTSPAIHLKPDDSDTVCYVNLTSGAGNNAINIRYNDTVYHTTN